MILTKGRMGSSFCTGIVLSPSVVLTAAHCVETPTDTAALTQRADGSPKLHAVAAIVRHPLFRADAVTARTMSIDVALVRLSQPLDGSFHAAPLVDEAHPAVGDAVSLEGFGVAAPGDVKSGGTLRRADLKVRAPLSAHLLWAEGGGAPAGACSGDSGAPIFAADGALIAIVAWADGGDARGCGGVTQGPLIAPLRDWILAGMAGSAGR